jgi:hypothetical protein
MLRLFPNVPGQPHRWADAICAWARGGLVQSRYINSEATDADWQDQPYASQGMPNWHSSEIEFRVAPPALQPMRFGTITTDPGGPYRCTECNWAGDTPSNCPRCGSEVTTADGVPGSGKEQT